MFCLVYFSTLRVLFFILSSVSNSLDPDQAGQNVRPDLGPNCLQSSSEEDK